MRYNPPRWRPTGRENVAKRTRKVFVELEPGEVSRTYVAVVRDLRTCRKLATIGGYLSKEEARANGYHLARVRGWEVHMHLASPSGAQWLGEAPGGGLAGSARGPRWVGSGRTLQARLRALWGAEQGPYASD